MPAVIKLGVLRLEIGDPTTIIEHSGHYTSQIRRFCRDFLDLLVKRAKLAFRKRSGVGGKAAVLGITNGYLVEGERREERKLWRVADILPWAKGEGARGRRHEGWWCCSLSW
jgi:hypothetical protein